LRFWQVGHGVKGAAQARKVLVWGQEGIARRLGAGERFESGVSEVLAGFEDEAFKFGDAAGVGCFLFERLEDGLHVLVKVSHG
jgi:hypothetical protein